MNFVLYVAIYFILWWTFLFVILPFGVRTQHDKGIQSPGTERGAPVKPLLMKKLAATTIITGIVVALLYVVIENNLFSLDDIPFLPRFGEKY